MIAVTWKHDRRFFFIVEFFTGRIVPLYVYYGLSCDFFLKAKLRGFYSYDTGGIYGLFEVLELFTALIFIRLKLVTTNFSHWNISVSVIYDRIDRLHYSSYIWKHMKCNILFHKPSDFYASNIKSNIGPREVKQSGVSCFKRSTMS